MSTKMTIMQGLPASGKSTRAKELLLHGRTVRINKDLIRTMLHFDKFTRLNEGLTHDASRALARHFLSSGISVIIDDTNLNPSTVQGLVDLAKELGSKIVHERIETPVAECVARDFSREKKVGAHVIKKMALQYKDYMAGEKVVICDLDGTLCDIDHRLHYVKHPKDCGLCALLGGDCGFKADWDAFFRGIPYDTMREDVAATLCRHIDDGASVIFVSARPERCRKDTEEWLAVHFPHHYETLIMRQDGDHRDDTEVKLEIYEKYLKKLDIVKVLDDRPKVIRMWQSTGLPVEDVGSGVEF